MEIRGVKHNIESYEGVTISKFKELYRFKKPYSLLVPEKRDKALEEDFKLISSQLRPKKSMKKPDELVKDEKKD